MLSGIEPIDTPSLFKRCLNRTSIVAKVLDTFRKTVPSLLDELEAALRGGDCAQSALLAHQLKGTASNVSALQLNELARQVEASANAGELAGATAYTEPLRSEFDRCVRFITETQGLAEATEAAAPSAPPE
jgi:HPt (histidine-containing phosphotransfer) domain-containing protein